MEPFKNIYNKDSITKLAKELKKVEPKFQDKLFLKHCFKELESLELKQRVDLICESLNEYLPSEIKKNLLSFQKIMSSLDKEENSLKDRIDGFLLWPIGQYVSTYALNYPKESYKTLYELTRRFSSEFAIRAFLNHDYDRSISWLKSLSKDSSFHARRLSSEGSRISLPWGENVKKLNDNIENNLDFVLPLANDDSEYVRRSVANHLNDISHINDKVFFKAINKIGNSKEEKWVKRHACRTLLKKGHPKALKLYGYNPKVKFDLDFSLSKKRIKEGDRIDLNLNLNLLESKKQKLLIEYCIYYLKKNNLHSKKAFRLKDITAQNNLELTKSIHFKKVTTRKHYSGDHYLSIQVNGIESDKVRFTLTSVQ